MKVAIITTDGRSLSTRWGSDTPSFGTAIDGLLDGLKQERDLQLHVISCLSTKLKSPAMLSDNIWFHQPIVPKWGWGKTAFLGCAWTVRKLLQDIKPDIVHGQGTERDCAMAAVLSGFPNVLTIHGNMRVHAARPEQKGIYYYKMAAALESFCLKRTDGVIAISNYTEELVKLLTPKTWLLPNAVDRRFFEIRPEAQSVPRILFVGSIDERKNPLGLLRACEEMLLAGECTLTFAGQANASSPYVQDFLKASAALPGVELLGFIARDELVQQFGRSTLLVLPTFEDNCPMVVLEAMAAGLPVAASRVGGVPDLIIHEHDGLMFDPNKKADMKACIEKLVKEPDTRARLGAAGRLNAQERFHPKVIAAEHLKIYREVLS